MRLSLLLSLSFLFTLSDISGQIIFKDPGPHHISPANPNGPYGKPHTTGSKPKPKPQQIIHSNSFVKPKPGPIPKPHHNHPNHYPPTYSNGCSNAVWVSGHWAFINSLHKKVWIEGYAVLTMANGIYVSGHWIETSHGLHWIPGHWISRCYPIYK